jgi:predicted acyltransferase
VKTAAHHIESLDVFRGATIAAMILVNNPGNWNAVFPQLLHANWNGCTAADVVFPFFVFIMGCAMPFAFERHRGRMSDAGFVVRVLRRGLTLVALGLMLNAVLVAPHFAAIRLPGVLQRLGLAYIGAAFLVRYTSPWTQGAVAALLMLIHWALMTLVPFAGYPAGTLTPNHNLAGYIDRWVFGTHTLTASSDPEGLLATLPTVSTALLGSLAGEWLQHQANSVRRCYGLAFGGVVAVSLGYAWSLIWPMNKSLWSGSYALVTVGLAALTLSICFYVVDVKGSRNWARPLVWLGVNPLAVYALSELTGHLIERPMINSSTGRMALKDWLFWRHVVPLVGDAGAAWSSLAYAACFTAIWILVAGLLYKRGALLRA